jgi:hypothetical protein
VEPAVTSEFKTAVQIHFFRFYIGHPAGYIHTISFPLKTDFFLPHPKDPKSQLLQIESGRKHYFFSLLKYRLNNAAAEVPTMRRNEIALITGVLPSRT